jgi:hypothetical protein
MKRGRVRRTGASTAARTPAGQEADPTTDTILVLTADRADDILAKGGSGDWVLNIEKAARHRYLVCCRKTRWDNRPEGIPDGSAFLVGVIKDFVKAERPTNARTQYRYRIALSQVARIERPNVWNPSWRNPVGYTTLAALGLDAKALKMKPLVVPVVASPVAASAPAYLTIAQAKKALAASFGVEPEDVEIHIRG